MNSVKNRKVDASSNNNLCLVSLHYSCKIFDRINVMEAMTAGIEIIKLKIKVINIINHWYYFLNDIYANKTRN